MIIREHSAEANKRLENLTYGAPGDEDNMLSPYKTDTGSLLINGQVSHDPRHNSNDRSLKEWGISFNDSLMKAKQYERVVNKDNMTRNGPSGSTLYNNAKYDMETLEKYLEERPKDKDSRLQQSASARREEI